MKKYLNSVSIVLIVVSLTLGVVFASDSLKLLPQNIFSDATTDSDGEIISEYAESKIESDAQQIEEVPEFSAYIEENIVSDDEVKHSFVSNIDTDNLSYEEYTTIESYLNFHIIHNLSEDETEIINSLLENGTPMGTIWEIYEFYLTTNDDFSIIEKIASYEDRYWGEHWIENAYNDITKEKHGVIQRDEAEEYRENFETSEILYANVLSRKGVYTIKEILQKHKDGEGWNEITTEIYSVHQAEKLSGSKKERAEISQYLMSDVFDYDSSPFEVYNLAFYCAKNELILKEGKVTAQNLSTCRTEATQQADEILLEQSAETMEKLNLPLNYMTANEQLEYENSNYNIAKENGMDDKTIELLRQKGFTMGEIANVSEERAENVQAVTKHIKSQRGDMLK